MTKSRSAYVELYCKKIRSGELPYSKLRDELRLRIMDEEDQEIIARRVDRDLQRMAEKDLERQKGKKMFYGGLALAILGICITTSSYMGYNDLADQFIIAYGPALGGLATAAAGMLKMGAK